jgi:hypothetical protein
LAIRSQSTPVIDRSEPSQMPFQLGYVSTACREMTRRDLIRLLTTARTINVRNGVTGLLLYQNRHFLQVLEGDEAAVRETFGRILDDPRHTQLKVLFEDSVDEREYEDWSMAFQALDGSEWLEFPDFAWRPRSLREVVDDFGRARDFLLMLRRRGLDPDKDLATPAVSGGD